jgi:hypothetical protein
MDWLDFVLGFLGGLVVMGVTGYVTAVRSLMNRIVYMRYVGFMGDPRPEPPVPVRPTVRED